MRRTDSFYWLKASRDVQGGTVIAHLNPEENGIVVEKNDTGCQVTALLRDGMLDLDRPIAVIYPDGHRTEHTVVRSRETAEETLRERGDRNYIFTASVTL
jgi:hypothetical protein